MVIFHPVNSIIWVFLIIYQNIHEIVERAGWTITKYDIPNNGTLKRFRDIECLDLKEMIILGDIPVGTTLYALLFGYSLNNYQNIHEKRAYRVTGPKIITQIVVP